MKENTHKLLLSKDGRFTIIVTKTNKPVKKIKHPDLLMTECLGYKVVIKKKEKDI